MGSLYTPQQLIDSLGLLPSPEGGYFLETYRAGAPPMESKGQTDSRGQTCIATLRVGTEGLMESEKQEKRNTVTSVYYMLASDRPTQFFNTGNSDLVHYWQSGGRIAFTLVNETGSVEEMTIGPKILEGDVMQVAVPGGTFKAARLVEGEYALLGVAAAPGFDCADHCEVSLEQFKSRVGDEAGASLLEMVKPDPPAA